MPRIDTRCLKCGSSPYHHPQEPLYRRVTVEHSKKSKWVRIPGFFYCTKCGAISIDNDSYIKPTTEQSEVNIIKNVGLGIKIIIPKETEESIQEKRILLKGIGDKNGYD